MNYTTLEQSKKLIEAGLDPNTADMFYTSLDMHETPWVWNNKPFLHQTDVPCWSLGKLIELMPKFIRTNDDEYGLYIYANGIGKMNVDYVSFDTNNTLYSFDCENLLEAVYYMICWLLENNYIKKGETK